MGLSMLIIYIHDCPIPGYHLAEVIEEPAKLNSYTPATSILAFFTNLLWAPTLANGKNQLNWVTVDNGKESWIGHQQVSPILMGFE
jgi:hypothetical protein